MASSPSAHVTRKYLSESEREALSSSDAEGEASRRAADAVFGAFGLRALAHQQAQFNEIVGSLLAHPAVQIRAGHLQFIDADDPLQGVIAEALQVRAIGLSVIAGMYDRELASVDDTRPGMQRARGEMLGEALWPVLLAADEQERGRFHNSQLQFVSSGRITRPAATVQLRARTPATGESPFTQWYRTVQEEAALARGASAAASRDRRITAEPISPVDRAHATYPHMTEVLSDAEIAAVFEQPPRDHETRAHEIVLAFLDLNEARYDKFRNFPEQAAQLVNHLWTYPATWISRNSVEFLEAQGTREYVLADLVKDPGIKLGLLGKAVDPRINSAVQADSDGPANDQRALITEWFNAYDAAAHAEGTSRTAHLPIAMALEASRFGEARSGDGWQVAANGTLARDGLLASDRSADIVRAQTAFRDMRAGMDVVEWATGDFSSQPTPALRLAPPDRIFHPTRRSEVVFDHESNALDNSLA